MKKITHILIFLSFSYLFSSAIFAQNQLHNHYSPYLAMHGNDPVNWMEWGEVALEKARKENKLIFVSIGYYACHWCHVMHRESYANPAIAKILNDHYIAIKIDRELNPVLDKRLINFVQATTGTAGWPLNVFITPEGYPLVGTTYVPKAEFSAALLRLNQNWTHDSKGLKEEAKAMNSQLSQQKLATDNHGDFAHIADNQKAFMQQAMQQANHLQGGFSQVRQFPAAPSLLALLRLNQTHKDQRVDEFIQLSLNNMQSKGLHDEIAGGFYRYTVDPDWQTPHFEKMLYTNALLVILYQNAADRYHNSSYQKTALETIHFLQADMQAKQSGAFIASLSAVDNKNVEGGYYLWKQKTLKQILDKAELKLANLAWGLDQQASLDAGILPMLQITLPELAKQLKQDPNSVQQVLDLIKTKLNKYRKQHRIIPKDNKQLAAWNGLTLAAFAHILEQDKSLKPAGEKLAKFLTHLWDGKQLRQAYKSQKAGNLGDYAAVAWGLIQWGKASNDPHSIATAKAIIKTAWQKFYTDKGWQEAESSLLPNPLYRQHIKDSPIPASEALLMEASQLAGQGEWDKKLQKVLNNSTEDVEDYPFSYAYLIAVAAQYK